MRIIMQYVFFNTIIISLLGLYLYNDYYKEEKLAIQKTSNTSLLISEWIKSSFNLTDYLLRDILNYVKQEDLTYPHPNPKEQKRLTKIMTEKMNTVPNAILVGIFNKDCIITHGNKTEPGWDGSKRDYCIKLRENPKQSVFVTNAYVSSTGPLNVTQSRKFLENDAGFHGFSAVGVSLEFFSTWLEQINTGPQGEVAIVDLKLQLLARKPIIPDSLGKTINAPALQDFIMSDLDEKTLTIKSPFDQISRIYSVRKVSGLPFVVIVGEAEDESMNHWKSLLSLSIIAVTFILIFSWIVLKNYKLIVEQKNDLIQARENLTLLANYDELTKLPTRRLGIDRIRNALAMAKRNKTKVGILLIDLDGFKAVNDNYGHESGDKLLIEVAKRLSGCIREMDTVARLGGDEFIAVLPNVMKNDDAVHIANKFVKVLTETFYINEQNIKIGGSIGIALYPDHEDSAENLMLCADKAMYKIKNSGKNGYLIYTEDK